MNTEIEITANQIFKENQVLTLSKAQSLIGKRLAITNSEHKHNSPSVRVFTLTGIKSEWDIAAKVDWTHTHGGVFATQQDYWLTLSKEAINGFKNKLKLVGDSENIFASCIIGNPYFKEDTFFGSDADREIFYIVLDYVDYPELLPFFESAAKEDYPFMARRIYSSLEPRPDADRINSLLEETNCKNPFNSEETYIHENLEKLCDLFFEWQCDKTRRESIKL